MFTGILISQSLRCLLLFVRNNPSNPFLEEILVFSLSHSERIAEGKRLQVGHNSCIEGNAGCYKKKPKAERIVPAENC